MARRGGTGIGIWIVGLLVAAVVGIGIIYAIMYGADVVGMGADAPVVGPVLSSVKGAVILAFAGVISLLVAWYYMSSRGGF